MKYFALLLALFFTYQKTIDALNPWWRLIIFPILFILVKYRDRFSESLEILRSKKNTLLVLKVIFILLLSFRSGKAIYNTARPLKAIEDIAVVHKKSVDLLFLKKENPYKHILYEQAPITIERNGVKDTYSGFIYTPLGIIYYAPFILWLGKKGMYAGNFLGYFGMLLLILYVLRKDKIKMYLAGILFCSVDYVFTKAFNRGTNDFLPSFLMLASILSTNKKIHGLWLGLSLGLKQYPGAILSFIYVLDKRVKSLLIACLTFTLCLLPFILNDFNSLYRQIFEVFLYAPMGNTILQDVPQSIMWIIPILAVIAMAWSHLLLKNKFYWLSYLLPFLLFIIFTKSSFTTYFICIFPISILFFLQAPSKNEWE